MHTPGRTRGAMGDMLPGRRVSRNELAGQRLSKTRGWVATAGGRPYRAPLSPPGPPSPACCRQRLPLPSCSAATTVGENCSSSGFKGIGTWVLRMWKIKGVLYSYRRNSNGDELRLGLRRRLLDGSSGSSTRALRRAAGMRRHGCGHPCHARHASSWSQLVRLCICRLRCRQRAAE